MEEKIESLRRVVQFGVEQGKTNVIVDLDVLQAILGSGNQTLPIDELTERFYAVREERERLKAAIRRHRDTRGDDRCWLDDQELYKALGEDGPRDGTIGSPPREEFLESCRRFYEQRMAPYGSQKTPGCMTIAQLEAEVARLRDERDALATEIAFRNDDIKRGITEAIQLMKWGKRPHPTLGTIGPILVTYDAAAQEQREC